MPEAEQIGACALRAGEFRSLLNARIGPYRRRMLTLLGSETCDPAVVEVIAGLDPVLAAQILRHASEPPMAGKEVPETLFQATRHASAKTLRAICEARPSESSTFSWRRSWPSCAGLLEHSLATAAGARCLARIRRHSDPSGAYLAGLLHSLGRFAMLEKYGEAYLSFSLSTFLSEPEHRREESKRFGEDHRDLGGALAKAWNLPPILRAVISGSMTPSLEDQPRAVEIDQIVRIASSFAMASGLGFCSSSQDAGLVRTIVRTVALPRRSQEFLLREIYDVLRRAAEVLGASYAGPGDLGRALGQANLGHLPGSKSEGAPITTVRGVVEVARKVGPLQSERELAHLVGSLALTHTAFERAMVLLHNETDDTLTEVLTGAESGLRSPLFLGVEELDETVLPGAAVLPWRLRREETQGKARRLLDLMCSDDLTLFTLYSGGRVPPAGILMCDRRYSGRSPRRRDVRFMELVTRIVGQELERRRLIAHLEVYRDDAERDYLTGIYNRRFTMRLLEREMLRSKRSYAPLALILLDIDNFKAFNDLYGHLAGDVVLRELSRHLREASRDSDVVGRFGGEEFLIVLPDTTIENAYVFAERLRKKVEEYGRDKLTQYPDRPPTISIGVGWVKPEKDTAESAIDRVDRALYASKQAGRNRVCLGVTDEEVP